MLFRIALILAFLVIALAGVAVTRLPWFIEQRLRASFSQRGFQEIALQVVRTGPRDLEIAELHLSRPGWTAHAARTQVRFRPFAFLNNDYEILDLSGFDMDIDVGELMRSRTFRLPTSLRALHRANHYDLIRLHQAHIHLRRGSAVEHFEITGDLRTHGPVDLKVTGEGVSLFSLGIQGETSGERGNASLHTKLKSASLAPLLEALVPRWLQKNPVYAVDGVELTASFQFIADRPVVSDAGGILHWKGWNFDHGRVLPAQVHTQKQGDAVILRSDTLQLERDDGLSARGFVEATFAPEGSAADTPFLQGRLHVESASSPEGNLSPLVVPFSGTPANLRLGPAVLTLPGSGGNTLRDLWIRLENPPDSPLNADGKAMLDFPLPVLASTTSPPKVLSLPTIGRLQSAPGNRSLDFTVQAEDGRGNPLQLDLGRFFVQLKGTLSGSIPPGPPPRNIPFQLDLPRMELRQQDRSLIHITSAEFAGRSLNGLASGSGKALWDGQPFAFKVNQSIKKDTPSANSQVTTSISASPILLYNATWPGHFVKAWHDTRCSGELSLSGTLVHEPGKPSSPLHPDLSFLFRNGRLLYPDGATTTSGIEAKARLVSLSPLLFAPGISLSVDNVKTGKVELKKLRLSVTQTGPEQLRIDSFEAGLLGGTIRIVEPVEIGSESPAFTILFDLTKIQGSEVVRLFPKFKGKVDASISGRVPVAVEKGKLKLLEGHLYLDGSQPAHLSYDASGFLTRSMNELRRNSKFSHSVERALGNLTIQSLDIRLFKPDDPTHPAIIKLVGIGIADQLNLPVNLTIPVEDEDGILQSLFSRILSAGMNVLKQ